MIIQKSAIGNLRWQKIIKLRGPIREFTVAVGAYSGGGLSTICCSRMGAYSRGALFEGGHSCIYGILYLT